MRKADKERAKEQRAKEKVAIKREKEEKASAARMILLPFSFSRSMLISRTPEERYSIKTFDCYIALFYQQGYESISIDECHSSIIRHASAGWQR